MARLVIYGAPGIARYRMPPGLVLAAIRFDLRPTQRNQERFERWAFLDSDRTKQRDPEWFEAFDAYCVSQGRVRHVKRAMRQLVKAGTRRILEDDPIPVSRDDVRWNAARELEDWPGPGRPEPDVGIVDLRGITFRDGTGDTTPGLSHEVDLVSVAVRDCGWFSHLCVFFAPAHRPFPMPRPEDRWLAYAIVVDDDGDGRADYCYGIDNAGGIERYGRMWARTSRQARRVRTSTRSRTRR